MSRAATPPRRKSASDRDRTELRKRVGAYVRARREQLGLSQGDIIRELGYVSRNSVSNVETGREGLPAKRIFGWADVLQIPRDPFFRFVTGDTKRLDASNGAEQPKTAHAANDADVLTAFRKLPPRLQKRFRDQLKDLLAEAQSEK